ncbi:acyltransferase family protein [Alteromonas sp. H39]|uniref:acyltransferase family protein n=1 Tax=Alteromonas sp. H39 TaxID=3389876 RepID=UPI0039DF4B1F
MMQLLHKGISQMNAFRYDIQGLRAVAVLLVVLFHADIAAFSGGYVGVDVFFVISGYLISGLLIKEIDSKHSISFTNFYARRIKRILPLSLVVTAATVLFFSFILSPLEIKEISKTALFSTLFSSNIWFINEATSYFGSSNHANPLLHTWSLGVEEQFYLIWPLIIMLSVRYFPREYLKWTLLAVSIFSLGFFLYQFGQNLPQTFFGPHTRAWQFGLGALVHLFTFGQVNRKVAGIIGCLGLMMILVTSLYIGPEFNNNAMWAIPPTLGACLLIWSGEYSKSSFIYRILASKAMVFIGTISFSLYLWHWPTFVYFKIDDGIISNSELVLALCAMTLLSVLSFYCIEETFRRRRFLDSNKRAIAFGCAIILTGSAVSFSGYFYSKYLLTSNGQRAISLVKIASADSPDCKASIQEIEVTGCIKGDHNGKNTIVVFGDSKAEQWVAELSHLSIQNQWKLLPILKSGCSPVYIDTYLSFLGREYFECKTWRDLAIKKILEEQPDILLITHFGGYSVVKEGEKADATYEDWRAGFEALFERLESLKSEIIYLRDNPKMPGDALQCLSRELRFNPTLDDKMCSFKTEEVDFATNVYNAVKDATSSQSNFHLLDFTGHYCENGICPSFKNNTIRYSDSHHLSYEFTRRLSSNLESELVKSLE